ncbi:MAG: hypothetical protein CMJ58_06705 [Planctomycetaceae bacterium]|nr:hypothetical protein [Planctomycetaceae bacterium]
MNRAAVRDVLVFVLLVTLGVVGRWAQPTWNFTPLAAIAAMAGFYFRSWLPAVLVPATTLAVSDLCLRSHDSLAVQVSVHVMMLLPLLLGRLAARNEGWRRAACWVATGVVPATAFFVVTNFAVWAFQGHYPMTLAGLAECYAAAVPFYRTMLAGDVAYVSALVATLYAAQQIELRSAEPRALAS